MSPEQDRNREADDPTKKIKEMLGSITDAISGEDYEFATDAVIGQNLISPADVVEYLHIRGKNEEDPVAQRRLRDGVSSIIGKLYERDQAEVSSREERSLGSDDIDRIKAVMQDADFQAMAENEVLAEEPNVAGVDNDSPVEPDYEWEEDIFSPDLSGYSDEEIEKAKDTVAFKTVLQEIRSTVYQASHHIGQARKILDLNGGKYRDLQLLILDEIVAKVAEEEAQGTVYEASHHIKQAKAIIKKFASDRDLEDKVITARMLASLDKYVARAAKKEVQSEVYETSYHIKKARDMIQKYASSPERAQAMLDELGL